MKNLKIAVVGAGVAGMAAAIFLKRNGHRVTIYEKFDHPKPLGAGLLMQPSGLAVLRKLGLDQQVIAEGSRIDGLFGKACRSKFTTLNVEYKNLKSPLFGVGVHRSNLFSSLYRLTLAEEITVQPSQEMTDIRHGEAGTIHLVNKDGRMYGPYDLIIDCSGVKSALRGNHAQVKLDRIYPYGALWSIVTLPPNAFRANYLEQRYQNASHMIGVLPIGHNPQTGLLQAAFFYSLKRQNYERWLQQPVDHWQQQVIRIWPETATLVNQFKNHQDLLFASYRDVILKKPYVRNLVFLGDAAHCSSPQLGQGANLALVDALILSQSIEKANNMPEALSLYAKMRKKHVRFYQFSSRLLTPFFQSDSWLFAKLRFFGCGIPCKIPLTQKIAARVLSGTKSGVFSRLQTDWLREYEDQCQ